MIHRPFSCVCVIKLVFREIIRQLLNILKIGNGCMEFSYSSELKQNLKQLKTSNVTNIFSKI